MSAPKNGHESFKNLDTAAVQAGRPPVTPDGPINPPIVLSSTMHAGGPYGYMRDWNATLDSLEQAIGALEVGGAQFSQVAWLRQMPSSIYSRKESQ